MSSSSISSSPSQTISLPLCNVSATYRGHSLYLTLIPEVLCKDSNLAEILWNFGRCKGETRLTLKQNPHFYKYLPRSREAYECDFRCDPIYTFEHPTIIVLTDNLGPAGRVFLESDQETRAFGNVWVPNRAIIFKGPRLSPAFFLPF